MRFNPPPGWPPPPPNWIPAPGWRPDPSWPPMPPGWRLWIEDAGSSAPDTAGGDEPFCAEGFSGKATVDGGWLIIEQFGSKGDHRIPVDRIITVRMRPAGSLWNGFIWFGLPGMPEPDGVLEANDDDNAVVFGKRHQEAFDALRDRVERAMSGGRPPGRGDDGTGDADVMEQLRKLAELRDAGVITPWDFENKKAELLARI